MKAGGKDFFVEVSAHELLETEFKVYSLQLFGSRLSIMTASNRLRANIDLYFS